MCSCQPLLPLGNHVSFVEELGVTIEFEGGWCFRDRQGFSLALDSTTPPHFQQLESLTLLNVKSFEFNASGQDTLVVSGGISKIWVTFHVHQEEIHACERYLCRPSG